MKIKVCGITDIAQMRQLQQLNVDYCGMIFYAPSPRFADEKLKAYQSEISNLTIKKTGVFVDENYDVISKIIDDYHLNAVQLHGNEPKEVCKKLMKKIEVIKVFRIGKNDNLKERINSFMEAAHYFLFDTDTSVFGGSGKKFDWQFLKDKNIGKPFFLSGGIGLEDAKKIKELNHPELFAADLNSRFETKPGMKNMKMIEAFLEAVK